MPNPNLPIQQGYNTYVGARYIPLPDGEWNATKRYEPLTIVMDTAGNSYTSKTYVPAGTPLTDTTYWVMTASYSQQVQFYRNEVIQAIADVNTSEAEYIATVQKAQQDFQNTITTQQNNFQTSTNTDINNFKTQVNKTLSTYEANNSRPVIVNSVSEMTDHSQIYLLSTDGMLYYWKDGSFINSNIKYGYDPTITLYDKTATNENDIGIAKVDSQPPNTIVVYDGTYIGNTSRGLFPEGCSSISTCTILSGGLLNAVNSYFQIATWVNSGDENCYTAVRMNRGSVWSPWHSLTNENNIKLFSQAATNENDLGISSIDNQPVNSVVVYGTTYITASTRGIFPLGCNGTCIVLSVGLINSVNSYCQIALWVNSGDTTTYAAVRIRRGDGWTDWYNITPEIKLYHKAVSNVDNLGITSINNQPVNSVVVYSGSYISSSNPNEFPDGCSTNSTCTVLSAGLLNAVNSYFQIAVWINSEEDPCHIAVRMNRGTIWSPWNVLTNNNTNENNIKIYTKVATDNDDLGITKVDNQPVNSIVVYDTTYMTNENRGVFPPNCDNTSNVLTIGVPNSLNSYSQIAMWVNSEANSPCYMAVRLRRGSGWTNWNVMPEKNQILSLEELNFIENEINFVSTCVNKPITLNNTTKMFVFGDSISTATHGGDFAWCNIVAEQFECELHNYSVPGATYTETSGNTIISQVQNSITLLPTASLIFVAAGLNDWNITNYTTLRTYVQNVINKIREYNTTAKIIFITPIRCTTKDEYMIPLPNISSVICNCALINKCSVINGYDFPIATSTSEIYQDMTDNDAMHPNDIGKWVYANSVITAIL